MVPSFSCVAGCDDGSLGDISVNYWHFGNQVCVEIKIFHVITNVLRYSCIYVGAWVVMLLECIPV